MTVNPPLIITSSPVTGAGLPPHVVVALQFPDCEPLIRPEKTPEAKVGDQRLDFPDSLGGRGEGAKDLAVFPVLDRGATKIF